MKVCSKEGHEAAVVLADAAENEDHCVRTLMWRDIRRFGSC
jgi:hypothetical protein